ncbi:HNH endonuclease family protein [Leifsonia sp. F6_8S_P_1B]|uniref:HNH endonuclease family protein n=1 Tax=Leifsonia williamsii TaxID=3035919 RepID=A0ABT8K842_9MICO|nr:HNH endonuclease family protein [Leifsonia williamsii]MDN4613623.1 HNH endonuclease family protein [Leifsonia williamsii]
MRRRRRAVGAKTGLGAAGLVLAAVIALCGYAVASRGGDGTSPEGPAASASAPAEATAPQAPAAPAAPTAPAPSRVSPLTPDADVPAPGAARALLAALPTKGRAPKTGYDRVGDFGPAWEDVDRNGCSTRDDILARDLTGVVRRGGCTVLSGTLDDPYAGRTIAFQRGPDTSARVQIDHVVALMNAWQTGAQALSPEQRLRLANDPLNLVAVDGPTNQSKGAGDAATWLPPAKAFRCEYASRQVAVKARYALWVVPAERAALDRILADCR